MPTKTLLNLLSVVISIGIVLTFVLMMLLANPPKRQVFTEPSVSRYQDVIIHIDVYGNVRILEHAIDSTTMPVVKE